MNEGDNMTFTCKEGQAINETKSVSRLKTNQISCFHQIKIESMWEWFAEVETTKDQTF